MELKGKVALITGASRGIGAQIAEELAKRGADLSITWNVSERSKDSATQVMERIKQLGLGTSIHGMAIDLALPGAPSQVIDELLKHYGKIDVLVNNAGSLLMASLSETTMEDYTQVMDLNLRAPFFLIQAAQPHLQAPARIINISSIAVRTGFPIGMVYAMSKGGLESMTRSMARAFGKDGTTVNAIAPGIVHTEMLDKWEKEWIEEDAMRTPVEQRTGQPEDIAEIVAWLASGSSRWVSGQTISASGGALMI